MVYGIQVCRGVFTVHTAIIYVYVTQFCRKPASGIILIPLAGFRQNCVTYTYIIAVCIVKTSDDGQRNCVKHVEFPSNEFEKLVHLVVLL
jgi:hypothetical protein